MGIRFSDLKTAEVGVWGIGREGRSFLQLARQQFPIKLLRIYSDTPLSSDEQAELEETLSGRVQFFNPPEQTGFFSQCDVVIRSPGVSMYRPEVRAALSQGVSFTTSTRLWFEEHAGERIVAVTGTKGKSTTVTMIGALLSEAGVSNVVAGNIGLPLVETLFFEPRPEVWVLELSSYQIADLEHGPTVGVLLNLFSAHLEWHGGRDRYHHDKLNLFRKMPPDAIAVVNGAEPSTQEVELGGVRTQCYNVPEGIHARDGAIWQSKHELINAQQFGLPGNHNLFNLCAALTAVAALDVDICQCLGAIPKLAGLPHRLELVGERDGIRFVNDSIATVPEAVVAALQSFKGEHVALIVGGQEKGDNIEVIVDAILKQQIAAVVTIPDSGPRIARELRKLCSGAHPTLIEADNLETAVLRAEAALQGTPGIVLLSPGAPSHGWYRNFEERGTSFAQAAGFGSQRG